MKRLSREKGFEFMLTVYPWAHQVSDTEWVPGRFMLMTQDARPSDVSLNTVQALSAASGIELLDLFPVFKSYQGEEPLYFAHDMHWTPAGNALVARGYEEFLSEKLLPHLCAKP